MRLTPVIVATATALALGTAAWGQGSGRVDLHYGNTDVEGSDFDLTGIQGAYTAPLGGGNLNFGVDGGFAQLDSDCCNADVWNIFGRIYGRTDTHAFGGYLGFADIEDVNVLGGGLEGAKFKEAWTLRADLGYFDVDDYDASILGLNGSATYFANENFALMGGLGVGNLDFGSDSNYYQLKAGAEYRFAGSPFGINAGVSYADLDDFNAEVTTWRIGGSLSFGTGSLHDEDNNGTSLLSGRDLMQLLLID